MTANFTVGDYNHVSAPINITQAQAILEEGMDYGITIGSTDTFRVCGMDAVAAYDCCDDVRMLLAEVLIQLAVDRKALQLLGKSGGTAKRILLHRGKLDVTYSLQPEGVFSHPVMFVFEECEAGHVVLPRYYYRDYPNNWVADALTEAINNTDG